MLFEEAWEKKKKRLDFVGLRFIYFLNRLKSQKLKHNANMFEMCFFFMKKSCFMGKKLYKWPVGGHDIPFWCPCYISWDFSRWRNLITNFTHLHLYSCFVFAFNANSICVSIIFHQLNIKFHTFNFHPSCHIIDPFSREWPIYALLTSSLPPPPSHTTVLYVRHLENWKEVELETGRYEYYSKE